MRLDIASLVPPSLFAFALGYIAFAFSIDVERMIGDDLGYDPGSRVVPVAAAVVLALAMLWEMVKVHPGAEKTEPEAPGLLVLLNIVLAAIFIAVFRPLGFILASCLFLHLLILLNLRHLGGRPGILSALAGLAATLACTIGLYSLTRLVVRNAFALARNPGWEVLRDPNLACPLKSGPP